MLAVAARSPAGKLTKPADVVRGQTTRLPWAWDGLCFASPMNEFSAAGLRDAVNGVICNGVKQDQSPFALDTDWFIGRDDQGNASPKLHSLQFADWPVCPAHSRPSTELTAYVRCKRWANNEAYAGWFCFPNDSAGPVFNTWGIVSSDATINAPCFTLGVSGSWIQSADGSVIGTTEYVSMFLRWRSGTAPRLDVYGAKGDLLSSVVHGSTISGALSYGSGYSLRLNADEYTTGNCAAYYSQAMVWSRRLGDTEVAALMADPYGWYSPRRETLSVASPFPIVAVASSGSVQPGVPVLRQIGHL